MNDEEQRLLTFTSWPTDSPIAPTVLAKAGFYYSGTDYVVKCFACDVTINFIYPEEDLHKKHKSMSPNCPYLLSPFTSENIPIFKTERIFAEDPSKELQNYKSRLETFKNWPYGRIVSPQKLAAAGFYALGHGDKVKCAFCYGMAAYWEPGDDPKSEHTRHFPKCKFVLANFDVNNLNVPPKEQNTKSPYPISSRAISKPISPQYDTKENRLASFTKWPYEKQQRPPALADAGFFYLGTGDKVQCFYCGGTLKNWQPEDDVWVEHARCFPACAYVNFIKGADFIEKCMEKSDSDSEESTYRSPTISLANVPRTINVIRSEEVANVTLNESSSNEASENDTIKRSIRKRRESIFRKKPSVNKKEKKK